MNTGAVSKILGVSSSTVQRWVKHLGLEMERNEFGHYIYTDEEIELLKDFKKQIQNGMTIQDIVVEKKPRKRVGKVQETQSSDEELLKKIREIEKALDNKADSVVTYQLLQHRNEIEELTKQIELLNKQIESLTENQRKDYLANDEAAVSEEKAKPRRKKMFSSIFGF